MNVAYIGLGSNIEPRSNYLHDAIQRLSANKQVEVINKSSIYETEPVGYLEQDHFLNMVIKVHTSLSNLELLEACQQIEETLGRERTIENGPRTIDLDILLYNSENRALDTLRIPHPRLHERAFVLVPLYEIAPHIVMPTSGKLIEDMLNDISKKEMNSVVKWNE
ncbi:2-amino-4-hydroxy-6-hydroxymethyldihydropteridine diphosphokinase [Pseudogracilibacillus auburnensis]|uniref:2-amino-4-hydroxy-6- hydroxymethyldihydropteridine diphosphokinase n=1 Tax=Pseudogracilibacillus auburnensis TaxID=1494959 RepID=UPI001A95AADB|nr:2-amino-4-hydroxy-6-hydroxymethyldihydropteridine diphosphokinase [Pseudogracilibacillus auburnensis]MBO1004433.1 2-amino-4-hydroxy-6-hydroxymethyldihydropteridine diphosphokinase [Pseudogracilibacillus auburnensis]